MGDASGREPYTVVMDVARTTLTTSIRRGSVANPPLGGSLNLEDWHPNDDT